MFCPNCGMKLPDDSVFCEECGARIADALNPAPAKPVQQAAPAKPTPQPAPIRPTSQSAPVRQPAPQAAPVPSKKSSLPIVLGIIGGALIIGIAIVVSVLIINKGKKDGGDISENETEITIESDFAKEETPKQETNEMIDTEGSQEFEEELIDDETDDESYDEITDIANLLSTTDTPDADDFEWFLDYEFEGGTGAGRDISDSSKTQRLNGSMKDLLNGGWKGYMTSADCPTGYDPEFERYFNAEIDTHDDVFNITYNWKYVVFQGTSTEDNGSDQLKGHWDSTGDTAQADIEYGKVVFDEFYISNSNDKEYAIGKMEWISGENTYVVLYRELK